MSKKIIIGLDDTKYSQTAQLIAFRRAKIYDAELIGIITVDRDAIMKDVGPAPVGGIHIAQKAAEKKINHAISVAKEIEESFIKECKSKKIKHQCLIKEGDPADILVEEGKVADLLIVGIKTNYHIGMETEDNDTLEHILKASICPVLAVTEKHIVPDYAIIAFDGSIQSANVLREFAHLNVKQPKFFKKVVLLNVNDNYEAGIDILKKAESYLTLYGFPLEKVVKSGRASDAIYELAKELGDSQVILGAYGESGLSEFFFGSTAKRVIEDGNIPMFVYN